MKNVRFPLSIVFILLLIICPFCVAIKDLQSSNNKKSLRITELELTLSDRLRDAEATIDSLKAQVSDLEAINISQSQEIMGLKDEMKESRTRFNSLRESYSVLELEFSSFRENTVIHAQDEANRSAFVTLELKRQIVELARKEEKYSRHKEQLKQTILEIKRDRDLVRCCVYQLFQEN